MSEPSSDSALDVVEAVARLKQGSVVQFPVIPIVSTLDIPRSCAPTPVSRSWCAFGYEFG